MTAQCENCRYFTMKLSKHSNVRLPEGMGECRRHAPRGPVNLAWTQDAGDGNAPLHAAIISAFAPVPVDDWCAEFSPKTSETQPEGWPR